MKIVLSDLGKRYNTEWIFRHLSFTFESDHNYVILGSNGSGKSTLLQVLSGLAFPSQGTINYFIGERAIPQEKVFREVAIATPYLELYEEFTLLETLAFHSRFKQLLPKGGPRDLAAAMHLDHARNKPLKYYSSGMKQRVRLALALFSDTPLLLLDEPTSNLDQAGIDWYTAMIDQYGANRLIVVCSNNQPAEFAFCDRELRVEDYKKRRTN